VWRSPSHVTFTPVSLWGSLPQPWHNTLDDSKMRQQRGGQGQGKSTMRDNDDEGRWRRGKRQRGKTTTRENDDEGRQRGETTMRGHNEGRRRRGETETTTTTTQGLETRRQQGETTTRGDDNKGGRQQGETTTTTTQGLETCRAPGIDKFFLSFSFILYLLTSIYRLSIQRERWHRGSRCIEPPLYVSFNIFFYVLLH